MQIQEDFSPEQLKDVDEAVCLAEELVSNYFKMSSGQWLRNRYDVRTAKDLSPDEMVQGPFAQVMGYEGRRKDTSLTSSVFTFYRICIQDAAILDALSSGKDMLLFPFLLYVAVHELVHVVRFGKFLQMYEASSEVDSTMDEERRVHDLTHRILREVSVPGMASVLDHYRNWRSEKGLFMQV
ncbi:MAG: hypothetical protein V1793_14255 [Pseudomonadota bacterium]